ncbi:CASP-like protein 1B1 [Carex littledalei]|uniref:CASP-like protein n=1 Tax=Carex littledalei TaxID=544730 RepID=A0A833QVK5_9POAL|nr:CASP-like protein 1B1 [Carex littledalei]
MEIENGTKSDLVLDSKFALIKAKLVKQLPLTLRWLALILTTTAAIGMGLNKQRKTAVVAIVGTKPISQTFTAEFQQTTAFVYFVVANALASFYNIMFVLLRTCFKGKENNLWIHILDLLIMVIVATGAAAATSMAELGKNGNVHARWNPICDKFGAFCLHGGMALIASFVGALDLLLLSILSLVALHRSVQGQELVSLSV